MGPGELLWMLGGGGGVVAAGSLAVAWYADRKSKTRAVEAEVRRMEEEERAEKLAQFRPLLLHELRTREPSKWDIAALASDCELTLEETTPAIEEFFRLTAAKAVADGVLDDGERKRLDVLARYLGIMSGRAGELTTEAASRRLDALVASAREDSLISAREIDSVLAAGRSLGLESRARKLARELDAEEKSRRLKEVEARIAEARADGVVTPEEVRDIAEFAGGLDIEARLLALGAEAFATLVAGVARASRAPSKLALRRIADARAELGLDTPGGEEAARRALVHLFETEAQEAIQDGSVNQAELRKLDRIRSIGGLSNADVAAWIDRVDSVLKNPLYGFHTKIRGVIYEDPRGRSRQDNIARCREGDQLILEREPRNQFDRNAVGVWTTDRRNLGYLSKEIASDLAPEIDSGTTYLAWIVNITGGELEKPTQGVNIFLVRATPGIDKADLLRYAREKGRVPIGLRG